MPKMRDIHGWSIKMKKIIMLFILVLIVGCSAENENSNEKEIEQTNQELQKSTDETTEEIPKIKNEQEAENEDEPKIEITGCQMFMFHNNQGPMCLSQLDFLDDMLKKYPSLDIREYLTTKSSTRTILFQFESQFKKSEGVSNSFTYLPITFINNHAYSGFNSYVQKKIEEDLKVVCG